MRKKRVLETWFQSQQPMPDIWEWCGPVSPSPLGAVLEIKARVLQEPYF